MRCVISCTLIFKVLQLLLAVDCDFDEGQSLECFNLFIGRLVRLSSPNLNYIAVLGTIVLYLAIVLFVIPTPCATVIKALCIARLWFLSLGVSLAFGTIIMKMFRVYIIFRNPTPKRKKVVSTESTLEGNLLSLAELWCLKQQREKLMFRGFPKIL